MKISTFIGYAQGFEESVASVAEMERAGLDLVWVAEAYGFDAPSLMGYIAARTERVQIGSGIFQIYTRTPSLTAMTAAGIDALSKGRCVLGLGASGPQVIEGWHGVPYDAPVKRTREIIEICRMIWKREVVSFDGTKYQIPLPEAEGTGLGKPLKMLTHPVRDEIPIFVAALGNKNVEMTAELADGWLPVFFVPERVRDVWGDALDAGNAKRDPKRPDLQIAAGGAFAIGDGIENLRDLTRPQAALYIGGMGARGRNFYNTLVTRLGYEQAAAEIQNLYLDGKKNEAAAAVPDELVEATTLIGPAGYVAERVAAMSEAGVTHLNVVPIAADGADQATLVGELRTIVDDL